MNKKLIFAIIGIVVATGLAGVSTLVLTTDEPVSIRDRLWPRGEARAQALAQAEGVALTINGYDVSVAEFLDLRNQVEQTKADTESILSRVVPEGDPSLASSSFNLRDGNATYPEEHVAIFRLNEALFEGHKVDAMVIAGLIAEYAPYSLGVDAGLTVSDEQVQADVDRAKIYHEGFIVQERGVQKDIIDRDTGKVVGKSTFHGDYEQAGFIEAVGDKYWTTTYPQQVRRALIGSEWYKQELDNGRDIYESTKIAVLTATVEITGEVEIDATLEEAVAYHLHWEKENFAFLEEQAQLAEAQKNEPGTTITSDFSGLAQPDDSPPVPATVPATATDNPPIPADVPVALPHSGDRE